MFNEVLLDLLEILFCFLVALLGLVLKNPPGFTIQHPMHHVALGGGCLKGHALDDMLKVLAPEQEIFWCTCSKNSDSDSTGLGVFQAWISLHLNFESLTLFWFARAWFKSAQASLHTHTHGIKPPVIETLWVQ